MSEALIEGFFSKFDVLEELQSNQGRNFEFQETCNRLGIQKTRMTFASPERWFSRKI